MNKLNRKFTEGRLERITVVVSLFDHWVSHKFSNNLFGSSVNGFKGLNLFIKESIDLLNSYNCAVNVQGNCFIFSEHVVLHRSELRTALMEVKRIYGFERFAGTKE